MKTIRHLLKYTIVILLTQIGVLQMAKAQNFTIGTIPDIQNLTTSDAAAGVLNQEMQFYVDNKSTLNLQMMISLGDYTTYGYDGYQSPTADWQRAKNASNMIRNAGIPYAVCIGNHDMDYVPCKDKQELSLTRFNSFYPTSDFIGTPTFGGYFRNMSNAYYTFNASGMNYLVVVVQTHDPDAFYDQTSITWANGILDQFPNHRAIFITHDFYDNKGLINDVVKKHDNVFLAICGHTCAREAHWTEETTPGKKLVNVIVTDYQCDGDKGATSRYYTFKPAENKIYAYTYNATKKAYETDANSQFTMDYEMNANLPRIALSQSGDINEGAENGKTIAVTLTNAAFSTTLTKANWSALNLPSGVTIGAVTRISNTQASITLSGNSTIGNYTANITNVSITASKAEIAVATNSVTANTGIILSRAPLTIPGKIEAEAYSLMNLIQLETCTDTGGGQNVGYIDAGDWMSYSVNVTTTADYQLELRLASLSLAGKVEIQLDGTVKQTMDLPITKAWQTWQTEPKIVNLTAGLHTLKINVLQGGFNLNWLNLTLNNPTPNPIIANVITSPTTPASVNTVKVSATITDDKSISSAKLFWGTTSTTISNQVIMAAIGNSYSATIPAQANGSTIFYKVTATDIDANSTSTPVSSYIITDIVATSMADYDGVDLSFTGFDGATFTKIANPVKGGSNTSNNVGQVIKLNASKTWAGIKSTALSAKLDFSNNKYLRLKVYSPKACTVLLKLEDASNATINKEMSVVTTKVNEWEELVYDFTGTAANTYNSIVLFFDFGNTIGNTFYFDDLKQTNDATKGLTTFMDQNRRAGNQFNVYPNPTANGIIMIEFNDNSLSANSIQIFDLQGNLLLEKESQLNEKAVVMNIQTLIPGLYVIKVAGQVQKLLVQ